MLGVTLRTSEEARSFWQLVEIASGFESTPSIPNLGYVPHLTLARYEAIDPALLVAACDTLNAERRITLVFDRICLFETSPMVLWLRPRPSDLLMKLHARMHEVVGEAPCDPHYLPGTWHPHCTIAASVPPEREVAARAFAAEPIRAFELTFDALDAVEWPPVRVIASRPLR